MKKIILLIISTLLITSCGWEEEVIKEKTITSFENPTNHLEKQVDLLEKRLTDEKNDKLNLVKVYLQYWNSYYKESVFADKALEILKTMEEEFEVEYLKWYAYEIKADYDKALTQYNKVLNYENITKEEEINALNQKGHIYDLQWFLEKSNQQYLLAEELDSEFIKTLLNRGRYESRVSNNDEAEEYFNKILAKTDDLFLKSELYYNLSVIYQSKKDWIDKAIEYAKLWIESNIDYPNNYLSLWVSYISKDWDFLDKALEPLNKSIELYPNSSMSYKYIWIYHYIKDDFNKAILNFKKQVEFSEKDILLMNNNKEKTKIEWQYDLARSYALNSDVENTIKYLKKILNWDNKLAYSWFLIENWNPNWPFRKISKEELYKEEMKNIILIYNKK